MDAVVLPIDIRMCGIVTPCRRIGCGRPPPCSASATTPCAAGPTPAGSTTEPDDAGRQVVDGAALAAGSPRSWPRRPSAPSRGRSCRESARNRFVGLVTRVVRDTVMAQVEIQAGPHRVVSLMSREAADELGLEPGVLAVAAVKSTNVVVEVPQQP